MTTWRWNENRTEQIGYVHLKNNTCSSTMRDNYEQGKIIKDDIFTALGLLINKKQRKVIKIYFLFFFFLQD